MSHRGERALGLDVGERRVGVAIGDELGLIASPMAVVQRGEGDLREIRDLAVAKHASVVVVGLPTGLSGREGPQAAAVRAFADELRAVMAPRLRVEFWDERLTTTVAERAMRERGGRQARGQKQKGEVDAIAAAVILQGYLDARRRRLPHKGNSSGVDAL